MTTTTFTCDFCGATIADNARKYQIGEILPSSPVELIGDICDKCRNRLYDIARNQSWKENTNA